MTRRAWMLVMLLATLAIVLVSRATHRTVDAVCTTDADCARWEVDHDIPEADRCHGGPCPPKGVQ